MRAFKSADCALKLYKAGGYGIFSVYDVYLFIVAMLVFGAEFDVNPQYSQCHDILRQQATSGELKARLLQLHLFMEAGKEV